MVHGFKDKEPLQRPVARMVRWRQGYLRPCCIMVESRGTYVMVALVRTPVGCKIIEVPEGSRMTAWQDWRDGWGVENTRSLPVPGSVPSAGMVVYLKFQGSYVLSWLLRVLHICDALAYMQANTYIHKINISKTSNRMKACESLTKENSMGPTMKKKQAPSWHPEHWVLKCLSVVIVSSVK